MIIIPPVETIEAIEIAKDLIVTGIIDQKNTIEVKENALEVKVVVEIEMKKKLNLEDIQDPDQARINILKLSYKTIKLKKTSNSNTQ